MNNHTKTWLPSMARISNITQEVARVSTYEIVFEDPNVSASYQFAPGQFNMLYVPGFGESAISLSSDPAQAPTLLHTVRVVGNVTGALARMKVGDQIGVRGPFGSSWPVEQCRGSDIVIACGGIGLPPLRPVIYHFLNHRDEFGEIHLLYGARTPSELLFTDELQQWRSAGIHVEVTVDLGDENWAGSIGVVPALFYRLRLDPNNTQVMTCGPEIMMRFVVFEALARSIDPSHIYLSLERNMSCALGHCGQCQLGPSFVCKDGPVYSYQKMEPYLMIEDL